MFRPIIALFLVCMLSHSDLEAQTDTLCTACPCLWKKAEKAFERSHFKQAIELYNAYTVCEPVNKSRAAQRILEIYQKVEAQKDSLMRAKQEVTRQRNRARQLQLEAEATSTFNSFISTTLLMIQKDYTLALAMAEYLCRQYPEEPVPRAVLKQIADDESEGFYYSVLNGHIRSVNCLGFFKDSQHLVTGSADSTLRIWDLEGKLLKTISFPKAVKNLAVSSQNLIAVVLERDSSGIEVLDETGNSIHRLSTGDKPVKGIGFSPDGQLLTAGVGNQIWTWNTSGTLLNAIHLASKKNMVDVNYLPDGQTFFAATVSLNSDAIIYQYTPAGALRDSFTYPLLKCNALGSSSDGQLLMSGGDSNDALIWDVASRNPVLLLEGHIGDVTDVGISPSNTIFATASQDGSLKLWGLDGKIMRNLHGHEREVNALAFSPDGKWLASVGSDKTVKVWRMYNSAPHSFESEAAGQVFELGFLPNQKCFFLACEYHFIDIWRIDGRLIHHIQDPNERLQAVSLSTSGKWLLSGGSAGIITVWDTSGVPILHIPQQSSAIVGTAFYDNDKNMVTAEETGQIKFWDWNGKAVRELKLPFETIEGFALSPDNQHFAVYAYSDKGKSEVALYDAAGHLVKRLKYQNLMFTGITFTADGKNLCVGAFTGELLWWSLQDSEPSIMEAANFSIFALAPITTQNWLLTGSGDHTLTIRDSKGDLLREFNGNGGWVTAASASTDGRYLVCVNHFGRIVVRDLMEARRWAKQFSEEALKTGFQVNSH